MSRGEVTAESAVRDTGHPSELADREARALSGLTQELGQLFGRADLLCDLLLAPLHVLTPVLTRGTYRRLPTERETPSTKLDSG